MTNKKLNLTVSLKYFSRKMLKLSPFPILLKHFSGQDRNDFTCPAKILLVPGLPDNGFVRP